jgi:hypothetical protein
MSASKIPLLPGETQDQYDAMVAGWRAQWEPDDYQEHKLVDTLIVNDWLHRRAERWLLETEASIVRQGGPDPINWTMEQQRRLQFAQQHKANAERAFYRAWSTLQGLRKDVIRRDEKLVKQQGLIERLQNENERLKSPKPEIKAEARTQVFGGQNTTNNRWILKRGARGGG